MSKMCCRFFAGAVGGSIAGVAYLNYKWMWMDDAAFDTHDLAGRMTDVSLGGYPMTVYCQQLKEPHELRSPLVTHRRDVVDVCVVGGGFAGLHTSLALAEKGKSVVVLEGKRVGSGASGRNAGDAVIGFHTTNEELAGIVGEDKARELFQHSAAGYDRLKSLIKKYKIQCDPHEDGSLTVQFSDLFKGDPTTLETALNNARQQVSDAKVKFGDQVQLWDKALLRQKGINTDRYEFGLFQPQTITLNPLELCLGLARACQSKGVTIYEGSQVTGMSRVGEEKNWLVSTPLGSVVAREVVLATSSANASISPQLAMTTTPVTTAIMLTKPLDKKELDKVFTAKCAVFDDRMGLAYFRRIGDRLLYGGLVHGIPMNRKWAEAKLLRDVQKTFPSLEKTVQADIMWQGRLDCREPVFPLVGRYNDMWYSLGFAGHGLVPTCAAGELIASAICSIDPKDKAKGPKDRRYQLWNEVTYAHLPAPLAKYLPPVLPCGGPFGLAFGYVLCKYLDFREW